MIGFEKLTKTHDVYCFLQVAKMCSKMCSKNLLRGIPEMSLGSQMPENDRFEATEQEENHREEKENREVEQEQKQNHWEEKENGEVESQKRKENDDKEKEEE